jgi:hypothetical protein
MILFWSFGSLAFPQSSGSANDLICESISDAREMVRRLQDCELVRQSGALKDQKIANLEKELELTQRESEIKDRIIALKNQEIAADKKAFDQMKDISDRALKLAEQSGSKSNWQLYGLAGMLLFLGGLFLGAR